MGEPSLPLFVLAARWTAVVLFWDARCTRHKGTSCRPWETCEIIGSICDICMGNRKLLECCFYSDFFVIYFMVTLYTFTSTRFTVSLCFFILEEILGHNEPKQKSVYWIKIKYTFLIFFNVLVNVKLPYNFVDNCCSPRGLSDDIKIRIRSQKIGSRSISIYFKNE